MLSVDDDAAAAELAELELELGELGVGSHTNTVTGDSSELPASSWINQYCNTILIEVIH